jgi:hypothetical protein
VERSAQEKEKRWVSIIRVAEQLDATPKSIRTRLEKAARRGADGVIEAEVDGLRARKLGRVWKVQLGAWA